MIVYQEKLGPYMVTGNNPELADKVKDGQFFIGYHIIRSWSLFGIIPLLIKMELMSLRVDTYYKMAADNPLADKVNYIHERLY